MKKTSLSIVLLSAAILTACGDNEETNEQNNQTNQNENTEAGDNSSEEADADSDPIVVKTTLFPLEDFANKIGGEAVEVENIVPVGADAHTFEPTSQQMIQAAEADLFVYNGAGFEGFVDQLEETLTSQEVEMLEASAGVDLISYEHAQEDNDEENHGHNNENNHDDEENHSHNNENNQDHEHNNENNHNHDEEENHAHNNDNAHDHEDDGDDHAHGDEDPHVWLDPERAVYLAENIKDAFVEARPEQEELFTENFEELAADLEALHESFQEELSETSKDTIVVSHAGYGYWEEQYGIQQHGIAGLSPTNEPSIRQIEDTIAMMEDNEINYVLFEQNIPENITEVVRDEVGAESLSLHNLEALTEEDLENEEDYFSLMEQNLETLTEALQ